MQQDFTLLLGLGGHRRVAHREPQRRHTQISMSAATRWQPWNPMSTTDENCAFKEDVAPWLRKRASEHDTSVSRFVGRLVQERISAERQYEHSNQRFLAGRPRPLKRSRAYPLRYKVHGQHLLLPEPRSCPSRHCRHSRSSRRPAMCRPSPSSCAKSRVLRGGHSSKVGETGSAESDSSTANLSG